MTTPRPPREEDFGSRLRSPAVAARIGVWLGIAFGLALITGVWSHYAQTPNPATPPSPLWLYRVTQAIHVIAGTAAIPLLLVKLWSVYPKLFASLRGTGGQRLLTLAERGSIAVLVASAILQLVTGVMNVAQWYAWDFSFRHMHFALAFVSVGALLVHVAVKLPIIRDVLGADIEDATHDRPTAVVPGPVSRRGLLRITWFAAGVAVVTTCVGTLPGLRRISVLAVRDSGQAFPINRTARQAGVVATTTAGTWRCTVAHGDRSVSLSRADLLALPQRTHRLPIACVEGWSITGTWTGVALRDLLDLVSAPAGSRVRVASLQTHGADRTSELPGAYTDDRRTMLALALNGEPLALDHGYPARIMAPDRPGALQTKWVSRIEVL